MSSKSTQTGQSTRRMRGFERADSLLARQVSKAGEGRGFAVSRLLTHWADVAGRDIARVTRPVRITYGRGGIGATLVLLVRGAQAPVIQAELPRLRERVNACYGYAAVSRIQLTQTAPTGFAEGQADFDHAPRKPAKAGPGTHARAAAGALAGGVADPELRLALSRMGAHILQNESDRKANPK